MHEDLRKLIANTAEAFRDEGRGLFAQRDFASAGAALIIEQWLRTFVLSDRQQESLPEPAAKPPAKKRDRKPRQQLLGERAPETDPPPPPDSAPRLTTNGTESNADA